MNKYIETIQKTLALADTMAEAVDYLHQQTIKGYFADTAEVFTDTVTAFQEINQALQSILPKLEENQLKEVTLQLFDSFERISHIYSENKLLKGLEIVETNLVPYFKQWQAELERCLAKYTLS